MTLAEKLLEYAKKNPDGFTVRIVKGKIVGVKATKRKRFVVSTTNNDSIQKIKSSFRNNYSGYAGGWYDKKSGKYYIDKNKVVGTKKEARTIADRHNQKAYFDLREFKEIRLPKKIKLPVVKKNGKWYNTITNRYVSETTAKRYNSYFRRNPKATLTGAYSGYKYKKDKELERMSKKTREIFFKGIQLVKTKDRSGNTVYYAPLINMTITPKMFERLKHLDYSILDGKVKVSLYRLTRDKSINSRVYHILRWNVYNEFHLADGFDIWITQKAIPMMNRILNHAYKLRFTHNLQGKTYMYGHIEIKFYSDVDHYDASRTFAFTVPQTKAGCKLFGQEFIELLEHYLNKLRFDSYRTLYIRNVTIYLFSYANERNLGLARFRYGVLGAFPEGKFSKGIIGLNDDIQKV